MIPSTGAPVPSIELVVEHGHSSTVRIAAGASFWHVELGSSNAWHRLWPLSRLAEMAVDFDGLCEFNNRDFTLMGMDLRV